MKDIRYKITFHTYWHCGSGLSAGADVDALVVKDKDRLPYVPGKTMKGLLREAAELLMQLCPAKYECEGWTACMGSAADDGSASSQGTAFFSNATLLDTEADPIRRLRELGKHLYKNVASTSIDEVTGTAREHSLRKMEVTVPCVLTGCIGSVPDDCVDLLTDSMKMVKRLGVNRNRGLGRCTLTVQAVQAAVKPLPATSEKSGGKDFPRKMQYRCTLDTDVVLSTSSATEGEQQTLDFIPGNNFLGIVASRLYAALEPEDSWLLFHSGKVRFGDAHPLVNGYRCLHVPADMYYPKLGSLADRCYVYSRLPEEWSEELKLIQLKQCRSGYYAFQKDRTAVRASVGRNFAIKSAYDRQRRCSRDAMMYGYESLAAGTEFGFTIEMDDDVPHVLAEKVGLALTGRKHIGRSRTAQYGQVSIEPCSFEESHSAKPNGSLQTIYADGRLIFHDEESGLPTLRPDASQFRLPKGSKVIWEKSQVRTFRYAPWNAKRQAFDTDRMGFEKGSVFVVQCTAPVQQEPAYVGAYNAEGFGRVVYNPSFLEADSEGRAAYRFPKPEEDAEAAARQEANREYAGSSVLVGYLQGCRHAEERQERIYKCVNDFVHANGSRFKGKAFASQWGTIRSMANAQADGRELMRLLFDGQKGYLNHGVSKEKWLERGRLYVFEKFCRATPAEDLQLTLVNLASEMAKTADKE